MESRWQSEPRIESMAGEREWEGLVVIPQGADESPASQTGAVPRAPAAGQRAEPVPVPRSSTRLSGRRHRRHLIRTDPFLPFLHHPSPPPPSTRPSPLPPSRLSFLILFRRLLHY
ncbi:hypothetical protein DENSPDRAFT_112087 [Dentipellis sp. KUC8613]|nr:hypothetical protein DENSPDRAFT_112087 [Dentipellis sp. KUC8613]